MNITADNFFAENITFENDFNRTHTQLPAGSQALALLVTGDRAVFHNVRLLGNQDAVYAAAETVLQTERIALQRGSIFAIATSPETSILYSVTAKRFSTTARFTARLIRAASSQPKASIIQMKIWAS